MARKKSTRKSAVSQRKSARRPRRNREPRTQAARSAELTEPSGSAAQLSGASPQSGAKEYRSGSEFVREQPPDKPTREVVAEAEQYGLKVTPNLVRIVRFKMRHEGAPRGGSVRRAVSRGRPLASGRRAGHPVSALSAAGPLGAAEARFRSLVLELGTARARTLLAEIDQFVQNLV
jgi:hypothetical protein